MLLSFVMPEIILGVSLFLLFSHLLKGAIRLGTTAQVLGLITFQISYPFIIVRARLLVDRTRVRGSRRWTWGARPTQAIRQRAAAAAVPGDPGERRRSCSPTRSTTS